MRSILWYLSRLPRLVLAGSVLASIVSAGANLALMLFIASAFKSAHVRALHLVSFGLLCLLLLTAQTMSRLSLVRVTQAAIRQLRLMIANRIATMQQCELEQLGAIPILSVVSDDVSMIAELGSEMPAVITALCIAFGVMCYLLYISPFAFCLLGVIALIAIAGYKLLTRNASNLLRLYRQEQDALGETIGMLIAGGKELRLNERRHAGILADIKQQAFHGRELSEAALRRHSLASSWAQVSFFLVVASVIGMSQYHFGVSSRQTALTIVFGLLFLKGAIDTLLTLTPSLRKAEVAVARVEKLGIEMKADFRKSDDTSLPIEHPPTAFERVRFVNVSYTYSGGERAFTLGPISFEVRNGETLFITGDNGAGKTSLLKLLSGLYTPTSGRIELDGLHVAPKDTGPYRQMFSAIFQDFHVFERLENNAASNLDLARQYLQEFGLDQCVSINDSGLAFGSLSRGQQKRLALIVSLLEDKPIYLFDEWAADQDPQFRGYFYKVLLPRLRREGRTVIAVTHDVGWHQYADRVLFIRDGGLTNESATGPNPPPLSRADEAAVAMALTSIVPDQAGTQ
jgi:putative ATP-binding cassette transporter